MRSILLASSLTLMAWSCLAASPEPIARRDFYETQSGRIAVFPNARDRGQVAHTTKFLYFPRDGEYELAPKYPRLWFAANNVIEANPGAQETRATFLAIQIVADNDSIS